LEKRPAGRQLLDALQPGDSIVVDEPMIELKRLAQLASTLAKRGIALHVVQLEHAGLPGPQLADAISLYLGLDRRFLKQRAIDNALALRAEGRPVGRASPGWKIQGSRRGHKRLVPNHEERTVMMEIVKLRLKGWGFRKIATLLLKENVRWRKPDRTRRQGFSLEAWTPRRCEISHESMLKIMAEEEAAKRAPADAVEVPPAFPQSRGRRRIRRALSYHRGGPRDREPRHSVAFSRATL
jgi:hypothetical protein